VAAGQIGSARSLDSGTTGSSSAEEGTSATKQTATDHHPGTRVLAGGRVPRPPTDPAAEGPAAQGIIRLGLLSVC